MTGVHRPYATPKNRRKYPTSVTGILDAMSTGKGLEIWKLKLVAGYAFDYPDRYRDLGRDAAVAKLWHIPDAEGAVASERGTVVHSVNEAWAEGREVDITELVTAAAHRDKKPIQQWQGREAFVVAEIDRYVDALEKFWVDFQPKTIGSEEVVLHDEGSHSFIGQRDWTAELAGLDGVTLLDLKTTDKEPTDDEPFKGIYMEKVRLQMAAYSKAEWLVDFDGEVEVGRRPAYPIRRCCVLALRASGDYQLIEVRGAGDEWGHFKRLIDVHRWIKDGHKTPAPIDLTMNKTKEEAA